MSNNGASALDSETKRVSAISSRELSEKKSSGHSQICPIWRSCLQDQLRRIQPSYLGQNG